MKNVVAKDVKDFTRTTQLIIQEALSRGWSVAALYEGSSHIFVDKGDKKPVHIFGSVLPGTNYSAGALVNDKLATYKFLENQGIPQLKAITVSKSEPLKLKNEQIERLGGRVVVKPLDSAHSNGVSLNVTNVDQLKRAIEVAASFSTEEEILIQEQFEADDIFDIRIICINKKFVAAVHRLPATVIGDGKSSISELINRENKSNKRGEPYKSEYSRIDIDAAKRYLGSGIDRIPGKEESVRVVGAANYGTGGELVDVTDEIPSWLKADAEKVCQALGMPIAGLDFLMGEAPDKNLKREDVDTFLIEVNKSPSLFIHDEPHKGKNRKTVSKFLDLI